MPHCYRDVPPPEAESMTPKKWAALEAAHEAGYIRFVNIVCRACHGTGTVYMQHRQVFETDSDDEIADAYSRESCPECKNLNLSVGAILAYHKHAQDSLNYSYQLAGAVGAGVEALDNLSAVVHGEAPPHPWPVAESAELQQAEEIRAAAVKVHEVFYRRAPGYFTEVECRVLDKLRAASGVK